MNTSYDTDRLLLRVCTKYDARMVLDFYKKNMKEFAQYEIIDLKTCGTLRFHESLLDAEFSMRSKGRMTRYYFFEKEDPFTIVGTFAFHDIEYTNYKCARVGYKVDKDYRRKGYAKEALQKGIAALFEEEGLHRVEAFVLPDNTPSIRLLESLGFEREGLVRDKVRLNGRWRDHYLYGRLNESDREGKQ